MLDRLNARGIKDLNVVKKFKNEWEQKIIYLYA